MRVILADDSVLIREGVARLLTDHGFEVVAQLEDAEGLAEAVDTLQPDVVVVDIRMPPTHTPEGLRAALELRRLAPELGVLVLSQHVESRYAMDLLRSGGGVGYLLTTTAGYWPCSPSSRMDRARDRPKAPSSSPTDRLRDRRIYWRTWPST